MSKCLIDNFNVDVILLINSLHKSPENIININRRSYEEACNFAELHNSANLQIIPLLLENLPGHQPGAGLPRKIAMDEAIRRFNHLNKENGVIVSLDADCTVDSNYLTEIFQTFNNNNKISSATINFCHPVEHLKKDDPLRLAITIYEKYLEYYKSGIAFCEYPYAYYTVGSAFAVRASTYVKAGGMGKQQGGEDFYFLQKVFPLGKTVEINSTTVYPAARISDRVPFGTGPALKKMITENEISKYTYSKESFFILKSFFDQINFFFKNDFQTIDHWISQQPECLRKFLESDHFSEKIQEINKHTSNIITYRKRFFNYFNAFKILKYLNFVHPNFFDFMKIDISTSIKF